MVLKPHKQVLYVEKTFLLAGKWTLGRMNDARGWLGRTISFRPETSVGEPMGRLILGMAAF